MNIGDFLLDLALFVGSVYMLCALGVATLRWLRKRRQYL